MPKVSIVVPVYNEKKYILKILEKLDQLSLPNIEKEIVVVDDGSTDGTREILKSTGTKYKIIFQSKNLGKAEALKTGFKNCSGEIIVTQDADLEYNPADIAKLIQPVIRGEFAVVYGSRMIARNPIGHIFYYWGNRLISTFTRFFYQHRITDVETGYKVFKKDILQKIHLVESGFGFEAEFTAKVLRSKIKILELPISYSPRKFSEGKKISWRDGIKALWLLIKYRFK